MMFMTLMVLKAFITDHLCFIFKYRIQNYYRIQIEIILLSCYVMNGALLYASVWQNAVYFYLGLLTINRLIDPGRGLD